MQWSILLSMPTLLFLVLSPQWGRWADRSGASYIIRYACFGVLLSILTLMVVWLIGQTLLFTPLAWMLGIGLSRLMYGLGASGIMPTCQSLAIEASGSGTNPGSQADESMKRLGLVSATLSMGRLLGPLILLLVASNISILLMLFSLVAMIVAVSITRFSVMDTDHRINKVDRKTVALEPDKIESSPRRHADCRTQLLLLMLAFGLTLFVGYLQFTLGPLFLDWLGEAELATMMMSVTLSTVAVSALMAQVFIVKRIPWRSKGVLLVLSFALLVSTVSLSQATSPTHVILLMLPIAFVIALMAPVYSRAAMALSYSSKGVISGRLAVAHTAGYPLGSLLAGAHYSGAEGWWLPLFIIAGFLTLVALVLTLTLRHSPFAQVSTSS